MKRYLWTLLAASALTTGCYTQGYVGTGYSYGYVAPTPDLYYMNDGVSVVAYADYPTFYSDNYYWMYSNGLWYRSNYYGGGWVASYDVPYRVRSIRNPHGYARFQPGQGWTRVSGSGNVRYNSNYRVNTNPPPAAYAPQRGQRGRTTYQAPAPAARSYQAPAPAARSSTSSPPPSRGSSHGSSRGGATVRDHRR